MKLTVVQWHPSFGDCDRNWGRMEEFSDGSDSDVIVFPELFSSGYMFESADEIRPHADGIGRLERLAAISRRDGKLIVGGFAELNGGTLYDSAFALSEGDVRIYRKIHLWARETQLFTPGKESLIVRYRGTGFGIEICYDLQFPELGRLLALNGADVILCPMAWAEEATYRDRNTPPFVHLAIAQAFSSGVFTAIANRVGNERGAAFEGHSGIADPYGNFSGLGGAEGILSADIDPADVQGAKRPSAFNDLEKDRKLRISL